MNTQSLIKSASRLLAIGLIALPLVEPLASSAEELTISMVNDAGEPNYKGSGFLHSITPTDPIDRYVTYIKPQMWRVGYVGSPGTDAFSVYDRLKNLGINRIQIVFSDWKRYYPSYSGLSWYDAAVAIAKRAKSEGKVFEWDLLNEPDYELNNNYYSIWNDAYRGIRSVLPDAVIAGPDLICSSGFKEGDLKAFLDHAKASNTVPNVVTWHFGFVTDLPTQKQILKDYVKSIGIDNIVTDYVCNENVDGNDAAVISTGVLPTLFAAAQRGDMNLIHATWPTGFNGAANSALRPVLSGILTEAPYKPRGTWWAYKSYAEMGGRMLNVTKGTQYDGVACKDPMVGKVTALIGTRYGWPAGQLSLNFTDMSNVAYLQDSNHQVRAMVHRVPCTQDACTGLQLISDQLLTVSGDQVVVSAPVGGNESVKITLLSPGGQREAETAQLSGGASVSNTNSGYFASGYVTGFDKAGATVAYTIQAVAAGRYGLSYKYSAGSGSASNIGLYINGVRAKTLAADATDNWTSWNTLVEIVDLKMGTNTIEFKSEATTARTINLDYIYINASGVKPFYQLNTRLQAENADLSNGAYFSNEGGSFSGRGFVNGFENAGARASFPVKLPSGGLFSMNYAYAAGAGAANNIGLYVNGTKVKGLTIPATSNWSTWAGANESVVLQPGDNTIEFRSESAATNTFALDYITIFNPYTAIKCRWQPNGNAYLYDNSGVLCYGTTPTSDNYFWTYESANGYTQIRNKATGNYINIEKNLGYVECSAVGTDWWSKDWTVIRTDDGYDQYVCRLWPNSQQACINIQAADGTVHYSGFQSTWWSQMWFNDTTVFPPSPLSLSPTTADFAAAGGSGKISLSSTSAWTIGDIPTWLTVSPTSGTGSTTLTLTASANSGAARSATLKVQVTGLNQTITATQSAALNTPPTISAIPPQTISNTSSTLALPFTIGDAQTPVDSLTLSASSDNSSVIPVGNIVFGGSGANRTVTVTPAAGKTGMATVTIQVSDSMGSKGSTAFAIVVNSAYQAWAAAQSPALTGGPLDDQDSDGLANIVEYAFGLNPVQSNQVSALPRPVYSNGSMVVTYTQPASVAGITYGAQWSDDLVTWNNIPDTGSGSTHTFSVPTAGHARLFFRHTVAPTP